MRSKSPCGYLVKCEKWMDDDRVYYMFRDMLNKKLMGLDPYAFDGEDEKGRYPRQRISKEEKQRIFNSFSKRYPDLKKKMTEILKIRVEYSKANKGWTRKSYCDCPFPFSCNAFPCDNLSCNADMLNNGYA